MRYIGNKEKIAEEIIDVIRSKTSNVENPVFCDLFAGTGKISSLYSSSVNCDLIINDSLYFASVYASASVSNMSLKKIENRTGIDFKNEYSGQKIKKIGFFTKNYSPYDKCERMYFSCENASKIDYIRSDIEYKYKSELLLEDEYKYLLACLMESVSKVANIAGVYGAYLKKWDPRAQKEMDFLEVSTSEKSKLKNLYTYCENGEELISKIKGDILYLDPPYSINDYSTQYHILETLTKNDQPVIKGITGTRQDKVKSNFSKKYQVIVSLDNLIRKAKFDHIFLSYNDEGLMPRELIVKILNKYSEEGVEVYEINHRGYTNKKKDRRVTTEYLFYIKKKKKIYIESPLNYMGSKFNMLESIFEEVPLTTTKFVDLFGGGFNVGINANSEIIYYNDSNHFVKEIIEYFKTTSTVIILKTIDKIIQENSLEKGDKEAYVAYRQKYNNNKTPIGLYVLLLYGFQQQLRFNGKHDFNNTVGMSSYNSQILSKVVSFSEVIKEKNVILLSKDYTEFSYENKDYLFYVDPPYLITLGSYNDGKRGFKEWNENSERTLYEFLDEINNSKNKFILSNVAVHKSKENELLKKWLNRNDYVVKKVASKGREELIIKNF